ncbi:Hypothetical predicted protein [Mytilus galloprovincialis]|uniref:Uncharacterized protein n=1 Tax=Mytilus galloprovincialis TaxID=29158 RepID=A0A8B6CG03_MYTGA|nr:Hypothetical predicted protein [Mytilus galloprovincialis]
MHSGALLMQGKRGLSFGVNHQSTDESESFATSELPSNFQRTDTQEQSVSIPSSLSNVFNTDDSGILSIVNAENCNKINVNIINNALSNKNSETSMESDSESSDNVMVGSDGDGSIIVHVAFCVKRLRCSGEIHSNVNEERTYRTYDEIGSSLYGVVSYVRPSETHDNQGENLTHQHEANISNEVNMQSTGGNLTELNADFSNDNLPQREVSDAQQMSFSTKDTNLINE